MATQKKILIGLGVLAALIVGYWLASPLWRTEMVSESLEEIAQPSASENQLESETPQSKTSGPEIVSRGNFSGILGHNAEGEAQLVKSGDKYFIRFEDNFKVTNGPDLFVYFGKDGKYTPEARLGALKGNIGGQNYEVPANIDVSAYNEVWVWCRAFSVPFGKALLQ